MRNRSKVTVKKSKIHGQGLFAKRTIQKDEVIGHIETKTTQKDGPYVLWIDGTQPVEVLNEFKYINHSRRPNCAYYNDGSVVALKKINVDMELTHNYSPEEDIMF